MEKKLNMNKPFLDSFCIYGDIFSILPEDDRASTISSVERIVRIEGGLIYEI